MKNFLKAFNEMKFKVKIKSWQHLINFQGFSIGHLPQPPEKLDAKNEC